MALVNTDAQYNEVYTKKAVALLEDKSDFAVVSQGAIPMTPVTQYVATYKMYKASDFRRRYIEKRASGADWKRINLQLKDISFTCEQRGYEKAVDDRHAAQTQNLLENVAMKQVEDGYAEFDIDFASMLTTTNFPTYLTGVASGAQAEGTSVIKWSDKTNSTPIDDIIYAKTVIKNKIGVEPDSLAISEDVYNKLRRNAQILALMSSYADKRITIEKLKEFFELDNIYVMKGAKTSTNEGQSTQTGTNISTGDALLYYRGRGGTEDAATIQVFYNINTYGAGSNGIIIQTYRDENRSSDVSRVIQDFTTVVSMADGGLLFDSIL